MCACACVRVCVCKLTVVEGGITGVTPCKGGGREGGRGQDRHNTSCDAVHVPTPPLQHHIRLRRERRFIHTTPTGAGGAPIGITTPIYTHVVYTVQPLSTHSRGIYIYYVHMDSTVVKRLTQGRPPCVQLVCSSQ